MNSIDGFKTCRKGLHQYNSNLKRCPKCHKEATRKWREENPERIKEQSKRWYEENGQYDREKNKQWKEENPDLVREHNRRWYANNLEQCRESSRKWKERNRERHRKTSRRWQKENPHKVNFNNAKRKATKKQAVAPWADLKRIKEIYEEAVELTRSTGVSHQVDHIYPLQSEYMCGLHVETNLQILTQFENASKNNRTWPGQLDCQRLPPHLNGFDIKEIEGD